MELIYKINGAKFYRRYDRSRWRELIGRARSLRGQGIAVKIKRKR